MKYAVKPKYTIHTIGILRNEIKNYEGICEEKQKVINEFRNSITDIEERLDDIDDRLVNIKSDTWSSPLQRGNNRGDKFTHLLAKKEEVLKEREELYEEKQRIYLKDMLWWQTRINTVDYYLSLLKPIERDFINDLYIHTIKLKSVKEKYGIEYDSDLYRKANNILKKLL